MLRVWMAGVIVLLLLPAAACQKGPQETQSAAQKEGTPAASATEKLETAQERTAPAAPAKSPEGIEAARRQLEQQGGEYTAAAFIESVKHGNAQIVTQFLAAGMNPNQQDPYGSTALMLAAEKGLTPIVIALLDGGADKEVKDTAGNTALAWAAGEGHAETVKALLDRGANVHAANTSGKTALMAAVQYQHNDVVEILKQAGAQDTRR